MVAPEPENALDRVRLDRRPGEVTPRLDAEPADHLGQVAPVLRQHRDVLDVQGLAGLARKRRGAEAVAEEIAHEPPAVEQAEAQVHALGDGLGHVAAVSLGAVGQLAVLGAMGGFDLRDRGGVVRLELADVDHSGLLPSRLRTLPVQSTRSSAVSDTR